EVTQVTRRRRRVPDSRQVRLAVGQARRRRRKIRPAVRRAWNGGRRDLHPLCECRRTCERHDRDVQQHFHVVTRRSLEALPSRIATLSALLRNAAFSTKSTPTGQSKG